MQLLAHNGFWLLFGMFMPESLYSWTQKRTHNHFPSFPSPFPLLFTLLTLLLSFSPPLPSLPSSLPSLLSGCSRDHYHHCCDSPGGGCAHLCFLLLLLHLVFQAEEDVMLCT